MKLIPILSLTAAAFLPSCEQPVPSNTVVTMIDRTDTMTRYPTAREIIEPVVRQSALGQLHIVVTSISDRDIDDNRVFDLPAESQWTSNAELRKARIARFTEQVQRALSGFHAGTCQHSIIYRRITGEANLLARSPSTGKTLIVCSDLMENDSVRFYDARTIALLKRDPDSISCALAKQEALADLSGIDIWLLYSPRNYDDNNTYMVIASFYERLLTAHGATVHLSTSFLPQ